jgi:CRISPR/Cas system-associated protein Cas10 (large subunit of type III CRISPR-Cas system)
MGRKSFYREEAKDAKKRKRRILDRINRIHKIRRREQEEWAACIQVLAAEILAWSAAS